MNTKTPLILISNDDGYQAPGINKLINMLRPLDVKILVCAPDGPRSGYSCAFSSELPLRLWHKWSDDKVDVWACNGTPVDCVKLAIDQLLEGKMPDMVIGGINHGDNSTVNNHYSGTMGIAKEGCMKYIPSIAISSCYYNHDANFDPLIEYVRNIVSNVLANGLPRGVCLNVNFPAMQEFKGVKVCRRSTYATIFEPTAEDTDQWALSHGYVAITPTRIDVTAYEMIDTIKNWNL